MIALLLLQSVTTCTLHGKVVNCSTQGAQPVQQSPVPGALDALVQSTGRGGQTQAQANYNRCVGMAKRAQKAGDHDAAARIMESCLPQRDK